MPYKDPKDPRRLETLRRYNSSEKRKSLDARTAQTDAFKETQKRYQQSEKGRGTRSSSRSGKMASDIKYAITVRLRARLQSALKFYGSKKGSSIEGLGCTLAEFVQKIEAHPNWESSWTVADQGKLWCLDHIRALALFDLEDPDQFSMANHHTNLQPLSVEAHKSKTKEDHRLIRWFKNQCTSPVVAYI